MRELAVLVLSLAVAMACRGGARSGGSDAAGERTAPGPDVLEATEIVDRQEAAGDAVDAADASRGDGPEDRTAQDNGAGEEEIEEAGPDVKDTTADGAEGDTDGEDAGADATSPAADGGDADGDDAGTDASGPEETSPAPYCGDGACGGGEDCELCPVDCGQCDPAAKVFFADAIFRATHNSYAGDIEGERGTFEEQLDAEVRFVELDFHDTPWNAAAPDYGVGHDDPGDKLWTEGTNPDTPALSAWLGTVAQWSVAHPQHLPITVLLDSKGDLTDNGSYALGNLGFLNDLLLKSFPAGTLLAAEEMPAGSPTAADLRGRILVVLSGNFDTRCGYRWDEGHNPAAAMNDSGQVVEVHDSGSGHLWYWTGQYQPDGSVEWSRHGRYDTGMDPAVAINNQGWIVEVHRSENKETLWYTVGELGPDMEIAWGSAVQYDTGVEPTIRFVPLDGNALHEIHTSENTGESWDWQATLDPAGQTVAWGAHGKTSLLPYEEEMGTSAAGTVTVSSQSDGLASSALKWVTGQGKSGRVRYRQVLFVESQKDDDLDLSMDGAIFFATGASTGAETVNWVAAKLAAGGLVRLWAFTESQTSLSATYPATDHPYASWYEAYCAQVGCLAESGNE